MKPHPIRAKALAAEAMRWGPSWERMQVALTWLAANGIVYQLSGDPDNPHHKYKPEEEYGLPHLFVYNSGWDAIPVRVGAYIVLDGGNPQILNRSDYERRYEEGNG